jgi:hypothetical protein
LIYDRDLYFDYDYTWAQLNGPLGYSSNGLYYLYPCQEVSAEPKDAPLQDYCGAIAFPEAEATPTCPITGAVGFFFFLFFVAP